MARHYFNVCRISRVCVCVCARSIESFTAAMGVQLFGSYTNFYSLFYTITSTLTSMWFVFTQLSWIVTVAGLAFCVLSTIVTSLPVLPVARCVYV